MLVHVVREAGQSLIGDVGSQIGVKESSANITFSSLVMDTGIHLFMYFYFGKVNSHLVKPEGVSAPAWQEGRTGRDEENCLCRYTSLEITAF